MNKVGYDLAVPGNHEFDYGMDTFLSLAKDTADYRLLHGGVEVLALIALLEAVDVIAVLVLEISGGGFDKGTKLANIGKVVIDTKTGEITHELAKGYDKQDEAVAAFVKEKTDAFEAELKKVVAAPAFHSLVEPASPRWPMATT